MGNLALALFIYLRTAGIVAALIMSAIALYLVTNPAHGYAPLIQQTLPRPSPSLLLLIAGILTTLIVIGIYWRTKKDTKLRI